MSESTQVLVVGAGPTGLLMAAELAHRDIAVRIIDKAPEPSGLNKALSLQARSLELMEELGLIDEFLAVGHKIYGVNAIAGGKRIVHLSSDELDSPYPFILMLPQFETERILTEHLASFGCSVERGVELSDLTQEEGGVRVTLVDRGGAEQQVEVPWLLGCDGAHSTTRQAAGVEFTGTDLEVDFAFVDAHCEWDKPDDEGHMFFSPEGPVEFIPLASIGKGYWRVVVTLTGDEQDEQDEQGETLLDLDFFHRHIAERTSLQVQLSEPKWVTRFTVRQRQVENYRRERVFLAGDAAHCHSPVGGLGMNTGLQDAYNLAWKLALVIRGVGRPELLDSYHMERAPIAEALLSGTEQATRVIALRNPVAQSLRNAVARFLTSFESVQERMANDISELAITYADSPIVGEYRSSFFDSLSRDKDSETASIGQRRAFRSILRAGDRAPDAVYSEEGETRKRLFDLLSGTKHTLLLFDGDRDTLAGYENLSNIAQRVTERLGDYIQCRIIVPGEDRVEALTWRDVVVVDEERILHRRYGADAECLYLIRPDCYIAFRSQPADADKLDTYLERIFVTDASG